MDKGFPKGHCNFLEFKKKSLDIVRRYNDVRVPDADGTFTKLGTTKEWRHKLTKYLAVRFKKVQGWITQEESRGVQLTNQEYEDRITKFEKHRTAEGIATFQPPPAGFKFKFVKKTAAAVVASLAEAGHESNHWDVHEERLLVSESGDLAATVDGSKSAGDQCHIHPQHSHTNAECYAQHPELRPTSGAQGGRGSGGGGGRGGNSNSYRTKDKRVCRWCRPDF